MREFSTTAFDSMKNAQHQDSCVDRTDGRRRRDEMVEFVKMEVSR
jgi:hypothetical protein